MTMSDGLEHFGPGERQRQEDRVARGHVGRRNVGSGDEIAVVRHARVRGQRRSADGAQVDGQLEMTRARRAPAPPRAPTRPRARAAGRTRSSARTARIPRSSRWPPPCTNQGRHSTALPLAFGDWQLVIGELGLGVESPITDYQLANYTPLVSGGQMYLCSCICRRAGRSIGEHPFGERARLEDAVDRATSARRRRDRRACSGQSRRARTRSRLDP